MTGNNGITIFLDQLREQKGLFVDTGVPCQTDFENQYLAVREKEHRRYSDDELHSLPYLQDHIHAKEWKLRAKSCKRTIKYFHRSKQRTFLDLGCGNGWYTIRLAEKEGSLVLGMDVNTPELEQATRVFDKPNLYFARGDIFKSNIPENSFDCIVLNASVQYFSNLKMLIERLFKLLTAHGEIHLIDSPFYSSGDCETAAERTQEYYSRLGFPEMAAFYFHHTYEELSEFDYVILYNPVRWSRILQKLAGSDMPFPWIRIPNRQHGK